MTSNFKI